VQATPAFQHAAELGSGALSSDQNTRLPSGRNIDSQPGVYEQSSSSVTNTTIITASSRMKSKSGSLGVAARSSVFHIDSSGDSNSQPVIPCGARHCSACVVLRPSGRLVTPSMRSTQLRDRGVASYAVVVGSVSISAHASGHSAVQASSVTSTGSPSSLTKSSRWLRHERSCSAPASVVDAEHSGLPASVVVMPMR
jgi:hypothetical protein